MLDHFLAPLSSGGAYRMVVSGVRRPSTFSKDFSSETTGPISIKFHMQPLDRGEKKVCIFRPGHMTKMAAMPIYGKNLKKSSPEPLG